MAAAAGSSVPLTATMIDVMRCDVKRYFWWWQSTALSGVVWCAPAKLATR